MIRSIFDSENPTPFKCVPVDNLNSCNLTLDKNRANIYKFKAKASKLITVMTHINVYECSIIEIISICVAGPWGYIGSKKETRTRKEKLVNYAECITAVQTKKSLYGQLYLKNSNTYETTNVPSYNCHISSRRTTYARQFRVRIMNAQLIPHKPFMVQSITTLDLIYENFKARALESPLSLLI